MDEYKKNGLRQVVVAHTIVDILKNPFFDRYTIDEANFSSEQVIIQYWRRKTSVDLINYRPMFLNWLSNANLSFNEILIALALIL